MAFSIFHGLFPSTMMADTPNAAPTMVSNPSPRDPLQNDAAPSASGTVAPTWGTWVGVALMTVVISAGVVMASLALLAGSQLALRGGGPGEGSWSKEAMDDYVACATARKGVACAALAERFRTGDGVPADPTNAEALRNKACEFGHGPACAPPSGSSGGGGNPESGVESPPTVPTGPAGTP